MWGYYGDYVMSAWNYTRDFSENVKIMIFGQRRAFPKPTGIKTSKFRMTHAAK